MIGPCATFKFLTVHPFPACLRNIREENNPLIHAMIKNLETADKIVKLVLAVSVIVLFLTNVIAGPFAVALVILSFFVLIIYAARLLYKGYFSARNK